MLSRFGKLVAVLVGVAIVFAGLVGLGIYFAPGPSPPTYFTLPANLTSEGPGQARAITPGFLGVNLRADYALPGSQGPAVAAAGIQLVRWPGGALADRLDPLADNDAGLIYGGGEGLPYPPASTAAQFVRWCGSVSCRAIISLPGEIDNPAYAAEEVNYFLQTLSFRPAYWEIGNEPAVWTHFGVAWTDWQTNQTATCDPTEYASVVSAYIAAIRGVDPTTPFIGLPGVGTGAYLEPDWISATVAVNGPNLSAVAIHAYPSGSDLGNGSLEGFFSSLNGPGGLPARVSQDSQAILSACPTCRISLLVDEMGVASSTALGAVAGFPWIPFESAEVVQALDLNVSGAAFWVSQGTYPGSWLTSSGSTQEVYSLFSTLLNPLPSTLEPISVESVVRGVYATSLGPTSSSVGLVIVVDANATLGISVNLLPIVSLASPGEVWTWSNTTGTPSAGPWGSGQPTTWTLPPDSLLVWRGAGLGAGVSAPSVHRLAGAALAQGGHPLPVSNPGIGARVESRASALRSPPARKVGFWSEWVGGPILTPGNFSTSTRELKGHIGDDPVA